jgi:prepilin-type processing-associated H-X9-DG protein
MTRSITALLAAALLAAGLGCKPPYPVSTNPGPTGPQAGENGPFKPDSGAPRRGMDNAKIRNYLHQVGILYAQSIAEHGKPPTDAKAFFEENKRDLPGDGMQAYEQGYFVTNFVANRNAHTLIMYEKEGWSGDGGRQCLFADGSVSLLAPADFQAALQGK